MTFPSTSARWLRAAFAAVGIALLTSCGGGSLQEAFSPSRFIAFGDEQSALLDATGATPAGRKYGVNLASNPALPTTDCIQYPNWTQYVASVYGFAFSQCPGTSDPTRVMTGSMFARPGAKVADVVNQVNSYLASGNVANSHLALVMVGMWDVIEQYQAVAAGSITADAARAEMTARGKLLADQVNKVALAGPAVINVSIPNLIYTPWGRAQGTSRPDLQQLLKDLTANFNTGLRVGQINNGRLIGYVDFEGEIQQIVADPGRFGYADVVHAACSVSSVNSGVTDPLIYAQDANLPTCLDSTLLAGINVNQWMWAGALTFSPVVHQRLALLVQQRVVNNPF